MDRELSEENTIGYWHPARRPNDDLQQRSSPIERLSPPTHHFDTCSVKPEVDTAAETNSENQPQSFTNSPEQEAQRAPSSPGNGAHRSEAFGLRTAQPNRPPEESYSPQSSGNDNEVAEGEDGERPDATWSVSRNHTQELLGVVDRSSSFPAFPTDSDSNDVEGLHHLPRSQAGSIMLDTEADVVPDIDMRTATEDCEQIESNTSDRVKLEGQTDSLSEELAPSYQYLQRPTNAEALFEEDVPLIDSESKPDNGLRGKQTTVEHAENQPWAAPGKENETINCDHPTPGALDNATNPSPDLAQEPTSGAFTSLNTPSGETSDFSQLVANPLSDLNSTQERPDGQTIERSVNGNSKGGTDVSALWEAVLDDDDDFLADDSDGFLPDSRPESRPGSPSALKSLSNDKSFQQNEILSSFDSPSLGSGSYSSSNDRRLQAASSQASNLYAPHQPSSSDLAQMTPTTYAGVGLGRPSLAPSTFGQNSYQGHVQRPAPPTKAESFVDQSKGGYKSPYDLPMDLSKPRKRVQMHQPPPNSQSAAVPPRRSTVIADQRPGSSATQIESPLSPARATFEQRGLPSSSQYSAPPSSVRRRTSNEHPSSPSFFAELPIAPKPRPPSAQAGYSPVKTGPLAPQNSTVSSAAPQLQPPNLMPPPAIPRTQSSIGTYSQYQLQRPERLEPYTNVPLQPSVAPMGSLKPYSPAPAVSQTAPPQPRYSPAPTTSQIASPSSGPSRYSPAPPVQPNTMQTQSRHDLQGHPSPQPPPHNPASQSRHSSQPVVANVLPFQPRTSSPLAYHGKKTGHRANNSAEMADGTPISPPISAPHHNCPPEVSSTSPDGVFSQGFIPPRRSQTQSPGKRGPVSSLMPASGDIMQRPASMHNPSSPIMSDNPYQPFPPARPSVRQRGLSQHLTLIPPNDDSRHDQLQRWRGSPIFRFALGGSVLISFPKHMPRYAAGSTKPEIKPVAGEVQLRNVKEICPLAAHVATFPGPLRSKSKKKELLAWLSDRIMALESMSQGTFRQQLPDHTRRPDEKVLLWKIVQVIVEHDGVVDGNAEVLRAMNLALWPASANGQDLSGIHNTGSSQVDSIYGPVGAVTKPEAIGPAVVESIRKDLLRGEREKAVWTAVDNRFWGHAMLLSSTLDKSIRKQVAHEFVRQQVKPIGANTEPLCALYEILAGNLEESIDELVPPSARAGLRMISKVGAIESTKSALDGLDRWRETLSLVLNNRSPEDQKALAALGRLLASYGRIEASHICHLFASSPMLPSVFGGTEDPQASIVLLGADHRNQPYLFFQDEDAILLTEAYEFAISILASNPKATLMPHLQAYKLHRVRVLAEAGLKPEAQAYCEMIGASLRSTTKLSPYHHTQFLAELDELSQRLSRAPTDTSSWISKPTMGKVSDSMWNKFTTFVAGDESDAASTGSGKDAGHEFGPFAKVSGTPTMSQPGSSSDLHGSYASAAVQPAPNSIAGSRYAPSGQYSARSSSELTRGAPSFESRQSSLSLPPGSIQKSPYDPNAAVNQQSYMSPAMPTQPASPYVPLGASTPLQPDLVKPPQTAYMPVVTTEAQMSPNKPRLAEPYVPMAPPEQPETHVATSPAPRPSLRPDPIQAPIFEGYPSSEVQSQGAGSQTTSSRAPPLQSYSSYEPPTSEYVPYQPDPSDSESEKPKPKKKSFMDDQDDFSSSMFEQKTQMSADTDVAAAAAARKKANDEAAEAAFRAAAEADAAKKRPSTAEDKTLKAKSSWFGNLWSRKESDSLDSSGNKGGGGSGGSEGQKVIRAKLGEESSFYYDKELKKWVNKKDPASMQQGAKAAPPPPKGPVGRVVSESLGTSQASGREPFGNGGLTAPPSSLSSAGRSLSSTGPPIRAGTPGESSAGILPPVSAAAMSATSTRDGRQSAPPTSTSASSTALGGVALDPPTASPQSRPASTALSTATDIDDLLGGLPSAGPRKPGGTLKAKKGRGAGRYVDVMAK